MNIPNFKVLSHDQVKNLQIQEEDFGIINLDRDNQGGTHWTCYANTPKLDFTLYFDSYGVAPSDIIGKFLKTSGKPVKYNDSEMQMFDSIMCGYYCLYLLDKVNKKVPIYDILYSFKQDPEAFNEKLIKNFGGQLENDLDGDGLRDIAKSIIDKVLPLRTNIPPKSRKVLETYGNMPVKAGWVCRAKLNQVLQAVIKATTRVKYDDLYHLSINFQLEDGTYVLMEKNEVINIQVVNANFQQNQECRAIENVKGLTLAGIVDKTRKRMGDQRFTQYNAITNNCQVFIKSIISANGMKFDDSDDFILQKVVGLVSKTPGTIAQKLTNFANRINRLVEGEGMGMGSQVHSVVFPQDEWTLEQAIEWLYAHGYKAPKVDYEANTMRFRQIDPKEFKRFATKVVDSDGKKINLVIGFHTKTPKRL